MFMHYYNIITRVLLKLAIGSVNVTVTSKFKIILTILYHKTTTFVVYTCRSAELHHLQKSIRTAGWFKQKLWGEKRTVLKKK